MLNSFGVPQSALVIGGTSEIALATIRAMASRGLEQVTLAGRSQEGLAGAVKEVEGAGVSVVRTLVWDVADPDCQIHAVDEAFSSMDDIDFVLLAAGVLGSTPFAEADPAEAIPVMMTNYVGLATGALAVANKLKKQGHGTIALLSSVAAVRPRRANYVYGSSKAAMDFFACGLAQSVAGSGVRVVIVRPGFVKTKMTAGMAEAPFATTADEVAREILRGLARKGEVVWAPGVLRWISVMMRHLPARIWKKVQDREAGS